MRTQAWGLVGRDRELAQLTDALDDAASGRGRVRLLSGGPGIGKTTLVQEVARHARDDGLVVLCGGAWESGGAPPFWPWQEALRRVPPATLDAVLGGLGGAAELVRPLVVPGRAPASAPGPFAGADPDAVRFALFDAVTRLLTAIAATTPVVVVLEDLHAADIPTLLLLEFTSSRVADAAAVLVLATFREGEVSADPERADIIGRVARAGRSIALRGVDTAAVAALAAAVAGRSVAARSAAALHEHTGGNPFFVRELVGLLVAENALDDIDVAGVIPPAVPPGVRAAVRRHVAKLSPGTQDVLRVMAVVGTDCDGALLSALTGGESALAAVDEACAAGLVVDAAGGVSRWRFVHALVRDTIYDDLDRATRRAVHLHVADTIEACGSTEGNASVLAHHYCAALPGSAAKAIHYSLLAAEQAGPLAPKELYDHARRACEIATMPGAADDVTRCEALLRLGEASVVGAASLAEQRGAFAQAAALARRLGDRERLARAAAGYAAFGHRGHEPAVVALLEEALAAQPETSRAARAILQIQLAAQLADGPDPGRATALARGACELADGTDVLAEVGCARAVLLAELGPDSADAMLDVLETFVDGRAHESRIPANVVAIWAEAVRCLALAALGRWRGASASATAFNRLLDGFEDPGGLYGIPHAGLESRYRDVARLAERTLVANALRQDPAIATWGFVWRFVAHRELGDADALDRVLSALGGEPVVAALAPMLRPLVLVEQGQPDDARAELAGWSRDTLEAAPVPRHLRALAIASLAEAAVAVADAERAAALYALLTPWAGRVLVDCALVHAPVDRLLGGLAAVVGDHEQAVAHYKAALTLCEAGGPPAFVARTRYDYARALLRAGRAEDRPDAVALATAAGEAAQQLGMEGLARDVDALLAAAAGSRRPASPPRDTRRSFRREGDHWTVTFDGALLRLADSRGLRILAALLANPGREFHALDLAIVAEERQAAPVREPAAAGVAARPLDGDARRAFQRRLADLRAAREEAAEARDVGRIDRADAEIEAVERELRDAYGLDGRARANAAAAERARLSVTKAVKAALAKIDEHAPALAAHLRVTVHTGMCCRYAPDPAARPDPWDVATRV